MTVKDKVGRKRYILIETDEKVSKMKMKKIMENILNEKNEKVRWRVMNSKEKMIIVRVDHKVSDLVRKELNGMIEGVKFKSLKTSGTMKSLKRIQTEKE
tara:strand:+ start:212 stop:508 length:297 start_codon:yes stop_codon:yes gene_type:complete